MQSQIFCLFLIIVSSATSCVLSTTIEETGHEIERMMTSWEKKCYAQVGSPLPASSDSEESAAPESNDVFDSQALSEYRSGLAGVTEEVRQAVPGCEPSNQEGKLLPSGRADCMNSLRDEAKRIISRDCPSVARYKKDTKDRRKRMALAAKAKIDEENNRIVQEQERIRQKEKEDRDYENNRIAKNIEIRATELGILKKLQDSGATHALKGIGLHVPDRMGCEQQLEELVYICRKVWIYSLQESIAALSTTDGELPPFIDGRASSQVLLKLTQAPNDQIKYGGGWFAGVLRSEDSTIQNQFGASIPAARWKQVGAFIFWPK